MANTIFRLAICLALSKSAWAAVRFIRIIVNILYVERMPDNEISPWYVCVRVCMHESNSIMYLIQSMTKFSLIFPHSGFFSVITKQQFFTQSIESGAWCYFRWKMEKICRLKSISSLSFLHLRHNEWRSDCWSQWRRESKSKKSFWSHKWFFSILFHHFHSSFRCVRLVVLP